MGATPSKRTQHTALADYADIPELVSARARPPLNPEIFRVDLLRVSHSILEDPLVQRTVFFPDVGCKNDLNWLVFGYDGEADTYHGSPFYKSPLTEEDCHASHAR